jgi:hypothetical protein
MYPFLKDGFQIHKNAALSSRFLMVHFLLGEHGIWG